MTIKIFGSATEDEQKSDLAGNSVYSIYAAALFLSFWIVYSTIKHVEVMNPKNRLFFYILGGMVGVIFMSIDTQISLLKMPYEAPSWMAVTSFLGYAFISGFVVLPCLRLIYTKSRRTAFVDHQPEAQMKMKATLLIASWTYLLTGFVIFVLCEFFASPTIIIRGAGMAIYLLGIVSLWISFLISSWGSPANLYKFKRTCFFMILALTLYASSYFIKDFYARIIEMAAETMLLASMAHYFYIIMSIYTGKNRAEVRIPLHEVSTQN